MKYANVKKHRITLRLPDIVFEAIERQLPLYFEATGTTVRNTFIISILNEALRDTIKEIREERKSSEDSNK